MACYNYLFSALPVPSQDLTVCMLSFWGFFAEFFSPLICMDNFPPVLLNVGTSDSLKFRVLCDNETDLGIFQ